MGGAGPRDDDEGGTTTADDLGGLVVLVVDDEHGIRELMERILSEHGATVATAASAEEALKAIALRRPDVLVSDIGMPLMDGYELAARVRELSPELARFTPLLGDILGFRFDDTPLTAALTPQQRHDRRQDLVEALVLAEAQRQPLLLIVDDLHWADASSIDMIARLARIAPRGHLLLLLGYGLDLPIAEPWVALEHCARLELRVLAPEDSTALVRELLHGEPPAELATLIEKTQGNPFFVEEVVRMLIERGVIVQQGDRWVATSEVGSVDIPESLHGLLLGRIDQLPESAKRSLRIAAVIGRQFPLRVLERVVSETTQ